MTVHVITIPLADPSGLDWDERADIRIRAADAYRAEQGTDEPVGVDLVVASMAETYELEIVIRSKDAEVTKPYELKTDKTTPAEVAAEVAGKLTYNYGGNLREIAAND